MSRGPWKIKGRERKRLLLKDRLINQSSLTVKIEPSIQTNPVAIVNQKLNDSNGNSSNSSKDKPWLWKKGQSGNPNGKPKRPEIEAVREALMEVEYEKKISLWKHLVKQAYEDNTVLIALARKFLPDKIEDESFNRVVRTFLIRPMIENRAISDDSKGIVDAKVVESVETNETKQLNESIQVKDDVNIAVDNAKSDPVNESKTI